MKTRNQRGFTLLQVAIDAALVAIAVLAVIEVMTTINSATKEAAASAKYADILSQVDINLTKEPMCRLSLGGPTAYGGAIDVTTNQTLNATGADAPVRLYNPLAAPRNIFMDPAPANNAYKFEMWTVMDLTIHPCLQQCTLCPAGCAGCPACPGPGCLCPACPALIVPAAGARRLVPAQLVFTLAKNWRKDVCPNKTSQSIRLTVEYDSAMNITSCTGLTFGQDIHQAPNCPANNAMYSNGTKLMCGPTKCGGGITPHAQADGSITCP